VTLRELAKRLRVGSPMTAKARLESALECGVIEYDDAMTKRGAPSWFKVSISSAALQEGGGRGVFPPPALVEKFISSLSFPETGGQAGQGEEKTRI
jgi:hypothetical protein